MPDSPIFVRTYDLLLWLVPRTLKFPREYRFGLAHRTQDVAFALQRAFIEAALVSDAMQERARLRSADIKLTELRLHLRLSHDLGLLDRKAYQHAAQMLDEIGRLLGGWVKRSNKGSGTNGQA